MTPAAFAALVSAATAPHLDRVRVQRVWGGARAFVDGVRVCDRGTVEDATAFAQGHLFGLLLESQRVTLAAMMPAPAAVERVAGWVAA